MDKELVKLTSRDMDELKALKTSITKKGILEELDLIQGWLEDEDVEMPALDYSDSTKKDVLLSMLIQAREVWFDREPEVLKERIKSCEMGELSDMITTKEI
jgi:hypothetical protein